ncbi:uncharacterized protein BDV14DRAFT_84159 [Aspergillus stella-maris]|uniref:uncharacterized protein n=1 Tax=Aspergillus stella-maris TaxID=1810926 RepID=UPI003CCD1AA6
MATRTTPRDPSSSNPSTSSSASASASAPAPSSSSSSAPAPASAPSHLPISALISAPSQNPAQSQSQSQSQSQASNSPSSLLWAYQLRQEHVALGTRMDRLNALFTRATNTIANLDSNVGQIADGMQVLEQQRELDKQEYDARVQELLEGVRLAQSVEGGGDPGRFEEVLERVVKVEKENGRLKGDVEGVRGKFGGLERENRGLRGNVDGLLKRVDGLQSENLVLKKDVKKVLQGSEELEKENNTLRGDFNKLSERFKKLQAENAELKKSFDDHVQASVNLSAENAELEVRVSELVKALKQKERESISSRSLSTTTAGEDKGRQDSSARTANKTRSISQKRGQSELSLDADQDTIISDSIPTPSSRHSRHRGISFPSRTLSDTTYGSQTDLDIRSPAESLRRGTARRSQLCEGMSTRASTIDDKKSKDKNRILEQVRQNGRTLGSFLKLVDGFRMQNPTIPAEMFVMAFQEAIEDESDKRRVMEFTGRVGLVWDRLSRLVHDIEWDKRENDEGDRDKKPKVVVDAPKREAASESLVRRREKKGRRSIPIVDEDDDDELFVT